MALFLVPVTDTVGLKWAVTLLLTDSTTSHMLWETSCTGI